MICPEHGPAEPVAPRTVAGLVLERLPSVIAIPLAEYATEPEPLLRLWAMCDTAEILLRLLVAVGAADVMRAARGEAPQALRDELSPRIERPSFGKWLAMASGVSTQLPADGAVPELRGFVERGLAPLILGTSEPPTEGSALLELRNRLAHGGGIGRALAQKLLELHAARFEEVLRAGKWLEDLEVVAPRAAGGPGALAGAAPGLRAFHPASEQIARAVDGAAHAVDTVVLVRAQTVLSLWPLVLYGPPESIDPAAQRSTQAVAQVYARREATRLFLTPLGSSEVAQATRGDEALAAFVGMFAPTAAPGPRSGSATAVDARLHADAGRLVGRVSELAALREAVTARGEGVLWVGGPAGIGKSFAMAKLAVELLATDSAQQLTVAYRFRLAEGACSRADFLESACGRLRPWVGAAQDGSRPGTAAELDALLGRLGERRVRFVVDGLDEIATVDPAFAKELPLAGRRRGVLWVCAGRPERDLGEVFRSLGAVDVFPGGLPRMGDEDVRALLIDGLERSRKRLLALDRETGGKIANSFVDAVTRRAAGLPLYVRFVLGDLLDGTREVRADPGWLPEQLEGYFEELLTRLTVSSVHQALTPLACTLAVAKQPLTEGALHALLERRRVVVNGAAGLLTVRKALAALEAMIRRVPTATGEDGFALYHESLREHLAASEQTKDAVATARRAMGDAAAAWEEKGNGSSAAQRYLCLHGLAHLAEDGRAERAAQLLCTFGYLMMRLQTLGAGTIDDVAADYRRSRLAVQGPVDGPLAQWEEFWRTRAHLLARGTPGWPAERILLQLAWEHAADHPVSGGAEQFLKEGGCRWQWLRMHPAQRPSTPVIGPIERVLLNAGGRFVLLDDGRRLASLDGRHSLLRVWDLASGVCERAIEDGGGLDLAVAVGARTAVTARHDGSVRVWDLARGACVGSLTGHTKFVKAVAITADAKRAFSASDDSTVRAWDLDTGTCRWTTKAYEIRKLAVIPDRDEMISGSGSGTIYRWNLSTGQHKEMDRVQGGSYLCALALSEDGRILATSSQFDGTKVWDLGPDGEAPRLVRKIPGVDRALAFSPDGSSLYGCHENAVRITVLSTGTSTQLLAGEIEKPNALAIFRSGERLLLSNESGAVRICNLSRASIEPPTTGHSLKVAHVGVASARRWVASGSQDGSLVIWNLESGACLPKLDGDEGTRRTPANSGESVVDLIVQKLVRDRKGPQPGDRRPRAPVTALALSADGQTLVLGVESYVRERVYDEYQGDQFISVRSGRIQIWDLERCVCVEDAQMGVVTAFALGAQGLLAVAHEPETDGDPVGKLSLLQLPAGNSRGSTWSHLKEAPRVLAFSPSGQRLASWSRDDGCVRLWRVGSTQPEAVVQPPVAGVPVSDADVAAEIARIRATGGLQPRADLLEKAVRAGLAWRGAAPRAAPSEPLARERVLEGPAKNVRRLEFSADERFVLALGEDCHAWNAQTGDSDPDEAARAAVRCGAEPRLRPDGVALVLHRAGATLEWQAEECCSPFLTDAGPACFARVGGKWTLRLLQVVDGAAVIFP